jgi:hypothetical protein
MQKNQVVAPRRGPKTEYDYESIKLSELKIVEGKRVIVGTPKITTSRKYVNAARVWWIAKGYSTSVIKKKNKATGKVELHLYVFAKHTEDSNT